MLESRRPGGKLYTEVRGLHRIVAGLYGLLLEAPRKVLAVVTELIHGDDQLRDAAHAFAEHEHLVGLDLTRLEAQELVVLELVGAVPGAEIDQ